MDHSSEEFQCFVTQEILPHLGPETDSCMGIGEINCDVGWVGRHDF